MNSPERATRNSTLSPTQKRVLLRVSRCPYDVQLAGYGRAPLLSAARALVRKGLLGSYQTGCFYLTKAGEKFVAEGGAK